MQMPRIRWSRPIALSSCSLLLVLLACSRPRETPPDLGPDVNTLTVKEGVYPVADETSAVARVFDDYIEFDAAAAGAGEALTWSPGRIITSPGGGDGNTFGFARKVESVEDKGNVVIVRTQPVLISDIFADGEFDVNLTKLPATEVDLSKLDPEWVETHLYTRDEDKTVFSPTKALLLNAPVSEEEATEGAARGRFGDAVGKLTNGAKKIVKKVVNTVGEVAGAVAGALGISFDRSFGDDELFTLAFDIPEQVLINEAEWKKEIKNPPLEIALKGSLEISGRFELTPGLKFRIAAGNPTGMGIKISGILGQKLTLKGSIEAEIAGAYEGGRKKGKKEVEEEIEDDPSLAQRYLAAQKEALLGEQSVRPKGNIQIPIARSKPYRVSIPVPGIGAVPVIITQEVDLECNLTLQGSFEANYTYSRKDAMSASLFWNLFGGPSAEFSTSQKEPPSSEFEVQSAARGDLRCGFVPRIVALAWGGIGPSVGIYGGLAGTFDYESSCVPGTTRPKGELQLDAFAEIRLQADGRIKIPLFGEKKLEAVNHQLLKVDIASKKFEFDKALGYCADSCRNGEKDDETDPPETDVDCGGGACASCGDGQACEKNSDCSRGLSCDDGTCSAGMCADKVLSPNGETGVDCGGPTCVGCALNQNCNEDSDCASGVCGKDKVCVKDRCSNGYRDEGECGEDCGGACGAKCDNGVFCAQDSGCKSGVSDGQMCVRHACENRRKDAGEADIDCGTAPNCNPCRAGLQCTQSAECVIQHGCVSGRCTFVPPTCSDKVRNQGESDIDCGGPCKANLDASQAKTCGLYCAGLCGAGKLCQNAFDCGGLVCENGRCGDKTAVALMPWGFTPLGGRVNEVGQINGTTRAPNADERAELYRLSGFSSGAPEPVSFMEVERDVLVQYPDLEQAAFTNLQTQLGGMFLPFSFEKTTFLGASFALPKLSTERRIVLKPVPQAPGGLACGVYNNYMAGLFVAFASTPATIPNPVIAFRCRPARAIRGLVTGEFSGEITIINKWAQDGSMGWNFGEDRIVRSASGAFELPMGLAQGTVYDISTAPNSQTTCRIENGKDTVGLGDVGAIRVNCRPQGALVRGTVTGAFGDVTVQVNGTRPTVITNSGAFDFGVFAPGTSYTVSVSAAPAGAACTVTNGSGVAPESAVVNVEVNCATPRHISGTVATLPSGNITLRLNGGSPISMGTGDFSFATTVNQGARYSVTADDRSDLSCGVENGGGVVATEDVTNVVVKCETKRISVLVKVTGLEPYAEKELSASVTLTNNGKDITDIYRDSVDYGGGSFELQPMQGEYRANSGTYDIQVMKTSPNRVCSVTNGSGTLGTTDVTNVVVTCTPAVKHRVRVVLAGARGPVVARSSPNGFEAYYSYSTDGCSGGIYASIADFFSDIMELPTNGAYTFPTSLAEGERYGVTIKSQPSGQTCTVTNGSGSSMPSGGVTALIVCRDSPNTTVGGTVSGATGEVVLTQDKAGEDLTVSGTSFTFTKSISVGATYAVKVKKHPRGQLCTVTNGSGTVQEDPTPPHAPIPVTGVAVSCAAAPGHSLSGFIRGASGEVSLSNEEDTVIAPYFGADVDKVAFTFPSPVSEGFGYNVEVVTHPTGQRCDVFNAASLMGTSDISDVVVTCANVPRHKVFVTLSGASGAVVVQNSGGDDLTLSANGEAAFATEVAEGTRFKVTVKSKPSEQTCTVSDGVGVMGVFDVGGIAVSCAQSRYPIGAQVSGVPSGKTITLSAGDAPVVVTADGAYVVPGSAAHGSLFNLTLTGSPSDLFCSIANGSGTASEQPIIATVACSAAVARSVGGTSSGPPGVVRLLNNGSDAVVLNVGAPFTFGTLLPQGASYSVTVDKHPEGQACTLNQANGTVGGAAVTSVSLTCTAAATRKVLGVLSGTFSGAVKLTNTGGDALTLSATGAFQFSQSIAQGTTYAVKVAEAPSGVSCSVSNASGVAGATDVNDVRVNCVSSQPTFAVAGHLLGASGTVVLRNNGKDDLNVSADGLFTFPSPLLNGSRYEVSVAESPAGQACSVTGGVGAIASTDVQTVFVRCETIDRTHVLGGIVSGSTGTVTLRNWFDGQQVDVNVPVNASFDFPLEIAEGAPYWVYAASSTTAGEVCLLANHIGYMGSADINDIDVTCSIPSTYAIGGTLSGANGAVTLTDNGLDPLVVSGNGNFEFGVRLWQNLVYNVTVLSAPAGQVCSVTGGFGIVGTADVDSIQVSCSQPPRTVGGAVSGAAGPLSLRINGAESLNLSGNGAFTFTSLIAQGGAYSVVVQSPPSGQSCTLANASGTISGGNVSNVSVTCATAGAASHTVGGSISGATGALTLRNNGADDLTLLNPSDPQPFTFASAILEGATYSVTVQSPPIGQECYVFGGSNADGTGTMAQGNVTDVDILCVDAAPSYTIGGNISGLGLSDSVTLRLNGLANQTFSTNGTFTLGGALAQGALWQVRVITAPAGKYCYTVQDSGTINNASVTTVSVTCAAGSAKRVFLSRDVYEIPSAPLDGLLSADAFCQAQAGLTGLSGTYSAWLSTSAVNAKDRFAAVASSAYHLPSTGGGLGLLVVSNGAGLYAAPNTLVRAIDRDQGGSNANLVGTTVWTGTLADGTADAANTCNDWTSNDSFSLARTGSYVDPFASGSFPNPRWNDDQTMTCNDVTTHVYCFEQ
jgi:hypothetical protein